MHFRQSLGALLACLAGRVVVGLNGGGGLDGHPPDSEEDAPEEPAAPGEELGVGVQVGS